MDVVEFSYFGAPALTPKEQLYVELVDGLHGSDPCIGSGSQVVFASLMQPYYLHTGLVVEVLIYLYRGFILYFVERKRLLCVHIYSV